MVNEFASQAVDYVRRALGITLEYDSETLPILDHYLRQVTTAPADRGNGTDRGNGHRTDRGNGNGTDHGNGHGKARGNGRPQARTPELVAATAGAYFGEVVRRRLGGSWHLPSNDPGTWRLVLPSGLWFWPVAMVMAAILGPDGDAVESPSDPDDPDDPPDVDVVDDVDGSDDGESRADSARSDGGWDASLQVPPPLRPHVARVLESMADVSEEEYYSLCCRLDTLEHLQDMLAAMARRSDGGSDALD